MPTQRWPHLATAALLLFPLATQAAAQGVQSIQFRQDDPRAYREDDRRSERESRYGAPRGSYLETCNEPRLEGSTLTAVCQGRRGGRFETYIDLNRCGRSDVGNNNGTLQCGGTRGNSRRID